MVSRSELVSEFDMEITAYVCFIERKFGLVFCLFVFFFGHPVAYGIPHIRSSLARDQIPATVATYITAAAVLDPFNPLCQAGCQTCVLALQRCYPSHCAAEIEFAYNKILTFSVHSAVGFIHFRGLTFINPL